MINYVAETDLDADTSPCRICGAESVLVFNWCRTCRDNYPIDFKLDSHLKVFEVKTVNDH